MFTSFCVFASDPRQVTSKMKEGLAKSLAMQWPEAFHFESENENVPPWAPLFEVKGNTGWIVNAARPIQKKYRKRKSNDSASADGEGERTAELDGDGIDRLGLIVPVQKAHVKQEIMRGMEKSFNTRKSERAKGETITFFLRKYIHFTSYGGEVITEEFARINPNAKDMKGTFLKIQPKLLGLAAKRDIELELNSDVLLALVLLAQHLPHDIPMKHDGAVEQSWGKEEDLMVVLQTKDNIDDYVVDRRSESSGSVQPYLIFIKSDIDASIIKVFLVLDGKAMELHCVHPDSHHAILQSFDVLMQAYVVFNVYHPFGWRNALYFIQYFMYGVPERRAKSRRAIVPGPSSSELWKSLSKDK